jgi:exodeoxyribonuclease VII small subunit
MRKTTPSATDLAPESAGAGPDALAPDEPASYEAGLAELEKLVQQLEGGQMPLEELLTAYQRGARLLAYCRDKLQAVEQQIKVLEGKELKPWTQE